MALVGQRLHLCRFLFIEVLTWVSFLARPAVEEGGRSLAAAIACGVVKASPFPSLQLLGGTYTKSNNV